MHYRIYFGKKIAVLRLKVNKKYSYCVSMSCDSEFLKFVCFSSNFIKLIVVLVNVVALQVVVDVVKVYSCRCCRQISSKLTISRCSVLHSLGSLISCVRNKIYVFY